MLIKLLKYDFLAVGKKMGKIFLGILLFGVLIGIAGRFPLPDPIKSLLGAGKALLIFGLYGVLANTLLEHYKTSFYKDRAYFQWMIPAGAGKQMLAKSVNTTLWIIGVLITTDLFDQISFLIEGGRLHFYLLKNTEMFRTLGGVKSFLVVAEIAVLVVLFLQAVMQQLYASAAVAQKLNKSTTLFEVITFILFCIADGVLMYGFSFLINRSAEELSDAAVYTPAELFMMAEKLVGALGIFFLLGIILYYLITVTVLGRKLNVQ